MYNSFLIQIFSIGSQIPSFLTSSHLKYIFKEEIKMNYYLLNSFLNNYSKS